MNGKKGIARLRNIQKMAGIPIGKKNIDLEKIANDNKQRIAGIIQKFKPIGAVKAVGLRGFKDPDLYTGGGWDEYHGTWGPLPLKRRPTGVFQHHRNFIMKLVKKGFKVIGRGNYSTVLAKGDGNRVIKVTRMDDGWIDYVKWGADNGYAGKFSPMVYSWKKFPAGFSVAVMERMDFDLDHHDKAEWHDYNLLLALMYYGKKSILARCYMEDICPGAYDFIRKLRDELRASDIRGANTMVRKDGTICFTDPVADPSRKAVVTKTRLKGKELTSPLYQFRGYIESCN